MTFLQPVLLIAFALSMITALVSTTFAHFAADHSRRSGLVPPTTPVFFVFSKNPVIFGVVPSFQEIYSATHRLYDNRFITGCVYIARPAFILAALLLISIFLPL